MTWRGLLAFLAALVMACVVSPPLRMVAWWMLRALAGLVLTPIVLAVEARRGRRQAEQRDAPVAHTGPVQWRCTLYVSHAGRSRVLARGVVPGTWRSPSAVEGEVLRRWVERHGLPESGRLCARAELVPAAAPAGGR